MLLGTDTERRGVLDTVTPALTLVPPHGDAVPEERDEAAGTAADTATCVCGHQHEAHEHYRPGSDCALCDCPRFRRQR
ncbi:hypothetical protein DEJ23_13055 [Curtobacterium sp. MCSS17_008]|uniref:hypothetical protein n=1 Tax=Curtobacterium sp. MCSS17_008 TaxID=2175647 RepID=UPI000DAA0F1F|nr:hypothetical protein [Curtobacterium sp. MCSS17_008]PZF54949.1 hypothetical protein DEJ23_13055 [Curtobacterium sp. MCSS17_008]